MRFDSSTVVSSLQLSVEFMISCVKSGVNVTVLYNLFHILVITWTSDWRSEFQFIFCLPNLIFSRQPNRVLIGIGILNWGQFNRSFSFMLILRRISWLLRVKFNWSLVILSDWRIWRLNLGIFIDFYFSFRFRWFKILQMIGVVFNYLKLRFSMFSLWFESGCCGEPDLD